MKTVEVKLREEMNQLEKIVEKARKRISIAPTGYLRIKKKRGGVEYYYKSKDVSSSNGRYMKKSEEKIVRGIAQRDYDTNIVKNAEERIKIIDAFLKEYEKTSLKSIYEEMNPYRRKLLFAPIIPDEEYIKQWQLVRYEGKIFQSETPEIITERGERVRSKSEKIIADKLYALGIPYRYEYPLVLEGGIKLYPDFTILRMPQRDEVYLEHLGLLDNNEYVESVVYKLNAYERNGIYLGVNLFITHETSKKPLNTRALNSIIRTMFCVEG